MNFLAHLYLADRTPPAMIGSLMPDLVRGRLPLDLPAATLAAVRQHRAIDAFTDLHPLFLRTKSRLAAHGRYAGILADVFYDHVLASRWHDYESAPLRDFVATVHEAFRTHHHLLPEKMRYPVDRLMAEDWLTCYASVEGIDLVLRRMSLRLSQRFEREVDLVSAVPDLVAEGEGIATDFAAYFPELRRFASVTWATLLGNTFLEADVKSRTTL